MNYLDLAMNAAETLGAEYADIRIQKTIDQVIYLQNLSLKHTSNDVQQGYGIRVFKNGAWGFAHNNVFSDEAVLATVKKAYETAILSAEVNKDKKLSLAPERSYLATYKTPIKIDPFNVPLTEKIDLLLEVNRVMLAYEGIKQARSLLIMHKDEKLFANTLGTRLDLSTHFINPVITAVAVTEDDSQSRTFDEGGRAIGWEWILELDLINIAKQIAEEALIKVKADTLGEEQRRALILDPNHLGLTMHESVGHATELDRVLGWEADYAGVSFATPEKLNNYQYGSELINFVGDNTLEGGLATLGFDDDGVPGQKWYIIKDGILKEYGSTRDTALEIGLNSSRGCNRATYYFNQPINRIPNLYLLPGTKPLTPGELIADTEEGVYIQGRGSYSIDHHRINFQFGGDFFWEIKNGKLLRPLKKVIYKSYNPEFWNSCDAICDERFWRPFGVVNCGKGQPSQTARMTHGSAPARFRNIRVGGSQ
ncbi:MAG TPA: TldD/PmbA family protein [Candidatus Cloacimonas sp.]|nr:TldD/PmbA family protein [Candidatus Cloacimonas sp.]MDD2250164.1 TldD/PmbA family protein [Candidatus Cloacimonadota bacterium]MDD3733996.1 TldD/PmbA family protein [Candidatus Cloacimonadota bacterium]MDD4676730.1 TldD/PmbA family protein [Candidatus Cloacimonadota bacterium]HPZ01758.1 TldD/PmbA family protein [Candidatus Cloacimonas sp.]